MKKIVLILIILLLPIVLAQEDIYQSTELEMQTTISSTFQIIPTSSNYNINFALVNLYFFPKENFQSEIITQTSEPEPFSTTDENIQYKWESAEQGEFSLNTKVKIQNKIQKVKNKIQFPIQISEFSEYAKPSETIDSNNEEIIEKASEIVQGTDDLYEVVFKLGKWVENNIEYSLNTATADVSQTSSWVLSNRYGVCDELTSLFIAMTRSLGIPTRFVAGLAYTNYNDLNDWGPHAWAEVYFPEIGWVPFDITYGQFGFVDPSHVVLRYSIDPDESSSKYEWSGNNIEIETQPLDLKVEIITSAEKVSPKIELNTNVIYSEIGFGSYNLIETEIKNLKDFYLAAELQIATSSEVEVIGRKAQQILLKPQETKKIFWKIKLAEELNQNYIYTIPIAVYSATNISSKTSFLSTSKEIIYSSEQIDEIINSYEKEEKTYSTKINLNCNAEKEKITSSESTNIICEIENKGNTLLKDINICLEKNCQKTNLGISQLQEISFVYSENKPGKKSLLIKAENDQISKSDSITLEILDIPKISITNITHPSQVEFKDQYELEFVLEKTSYADPENIEVEIIQNKKINTFEFEKLDSDQKIKIKLFANNLKKGENNIKIIINYKDNQNNPYTKEKQTQINLINVSLLENIQIIIYGFNNWLESLF